MASKASLNKSPKANWIEAAGGLPPDFREVVRGIMRSGKSLSQAIEIAWGTFRRWAHGGGDVTPATRAKAVKVLAQMEALRARSRARQVATAHPVGAGPEIALADPESAEGRRRLAKQGKALPHGGYPIPDVEHLRKAVQAFGRTPPARRRLLVALIRRRARALGVSDQEWVRRFLREHAGGTTKNQKAA